MSTQSLLRDLLQELNAHAALINFAPPYRAPNQEVLESLGTRYSYRHTGAPMCLALVG